VYPRRILKVVTCSFRCMIVGKLRFPIGSWHTKVPPKILISREDPHLLSLQAHLPLGSQNFQMTGTSLLDSRSNGRRDMGGCLLIVWAVAVCGMDAAG